MEVIYVSDGRTVDYYFNSLYRRRCFNPHKSLDSLRICLCGPVFNRVLDIFPGRYYQPGRNRHAGCHNADVSVNHQYGHPAVAKRAGAAVEDRGHLPRRHCRDRGGGLCGEPGAVRPQHRAGHHSSAGRRYRLIADYVAGREQRRPGRPVGFCHFDLRNAGVCRISAHRHHAAA